MDMEGRGAIVSAKEAPPPYLSEAQRTAFAVVAFIVALYRRPSPFACRGRRALERAIDIASCALVIHGVRFADILKYGDAAVGVRPNGRELHSIASRDPKRCADHEVEFKKILNTAGISSEMAINNISSFDEFEIRKALNNCKLTLSEQMIFYLFTR